MKIGIISAVMILVLDTSVWAHGENKPGPHGGFIRMPGAFHTEVVREAGAKLKIYLIDMQWKHPTTRDSSVQISLKNTKSIKAKCESKTDHFVCSLPKGTDLTAGELIVQATRENQVGNAAVYPLPLKLLAESHEGH